MRELVDLADERDLWVISAHSFSKTYAMTGWRVGYLTVPAGTSPRPG